MRKILLIITAAFCSYNAYCQQRDVFIYEDAGLGYGTQYAYKMDINCIFDKDKIISLGYYHTSRPAPDAPADYQAGVFTGLPRQKINMAGIMYGKVFYSQSDKLRYILKGGIALGNARTPANYAPVDQNAIVYLGSNYTHSYNTIFNYGVAFNPTMELPLSPNFGFSFGIFSLINPVSSSAGIEASIIFGRLRNKSL
jgi:hypothetical protein